jgi:NitT/TauT family transport system ATP-binding protein
VSHGGKRVLDDVKVDLPSPRTQAQTRIEPAFAELRTRVYRGIQAAKTAK